jgi:hypothetical protein
LPDALSLLPWNIVNMSLPDAYAHFKHSTAASSSQISPAQANTAAPWPLISLPDDDALTAPLCSGSSTHGAESLAQLFADELKRQ